jgi:hypothetical protein
MICKLCQGKGHEFTSAIRKEGVQWFIGLLDIFASSADILHTH